MSADGGTGGQPRLRAQPSAGERRRLIRVALGQEPADLFVRGGTVVNVYSGELIPANVAAVDDRIAYVGPLEKAVGPETEVIDAQDLYVAPGWIEPHSHTYLYYNPESLAEAILPGGTTTVVSDDLVFSMLGGSKTSRAVMDEAARLPVRFLWYARPEPASPVDAGSEDYFDHERLEEVLDHPLVMGVGEAPAWARFLQSEEAPLGAAIVEANRRGLIADGHTAGARDDKLAALVAAGLRSCHEAITADEALERLRLGLWTPLRHSSLRPDLPELLRIVTEEEIDTSRVLFTTDGPAPDAISEHGYLDGLLRLAVEAGVPPVKAIQMATINPATYLHLDDHLGGVAPGRLADLVLLPDLSSFRPRLVIAGGKVAAREGELVEPTPGIDWESLGLQLEFRQGSWIEDPALYDARPDEDLPVIKFVSDVITSSEEPPTGGELPEGYLRVVHLTRDGRWISRALVHNFASDLDGFATTATSSAHVLVFGRDPQAMALAASRVRALGGGMAMASGGHVVWEAALPLAGIMASGPFKEALSVAKEMKARLQGAGYPFSDPLYSLLFLTADFLPGPRLTWSGVLDTRLQEAIREAEPLDE
ncbi:MAG: Adenine deaminase [uncultured Rubrobacteraceae bacterium]|uniref:adenine deaminase n=1 Tax=uncultured Rubrobacteraceae bacterium TaxID=349277 RepID=A0A6J4QX44_9ACTN|nr:MAG: Adenine deaminase [uncultured Rubrobacteraceae bacterium]